MTASDRPVAATEHTELFRHAGDSAWLVVAFGSGDEHDDALRDAVFALKWDAMVLMPRQPRGYSTAEAQRLRTLLAAEDHRRVVLIGAGQGGEAALRHAVLFGADQVLAVAPDNPDWESIDPGCDAFVLVGRGGEVWQVPRVTLVPCLGLDCGFAFGEPDVLEALLDVALDSTSCRHRGAALASRLRRRAHADPRYCARLSRQLARSHPVWSAALRPAPLMVFDLASMRAQQPQRPVVARLPTAPPATREQVEALAAGGETASSLRAARELVRATPANPIARALLARLMQPPTSG
jgi:pimeloyl-ACP methyl ester carboxylesterase